MRENSKKIFVYKASDIKKIIYNGNENCILDSELINNDFLRDKYLIFENMGDGYAREYYSKMIFNLNYKSETSNNIIENETENQKIINLYNQYRKALKVPLLVELPNNYNFKSKIDTEIKKILQNNVFYEYQIISTLKELENETKKELKEKLDKKINKEYEKALCLNYVEHLKKTK